MEINPYHLNVGAAGGVSAYHGPSRSSDSVPANTDFKSSRALEKSVAGLPDMRPEAIARGLQLVGRVDYPPMETITKISNLLAMRIDQEAE